MDSNFFIKYKSINKEDDSDIDLATLGESISGFDSVIKEIFKISKIEGEIRIKITQTREGSLIIDTVNLVTLVAEFPFVKPEHLLNFLQVTDQASWLEAKNFFGQSFDIISSSHRTLNDYFAKNPLDQQVLTAAVVTFISYMFGKAEGQKKYPNPNGISKDYASGLHRMIKEGAFKKAIKPLIDERVNSIDVSIYKDFKQQVSITPTNFESYLSEDEKILPQYLNGEVYMFTGKIVAMQCSVGDSFKIRVHAVKKSERDLIAYPPEGQTTKDLENFYEEDVIIKASVSRESLYQKPKLLIQEIRLYQDPMF